MTARVARSLVDVATIGLLQERALRHQEILTEQLQTALNSRVIIEQAKGVLAERYGLDPEQAFTVLRNYARNHNHPLTKLARDLVTGTVRITIAHGDETASPAG
jgi:AmiR/NasT family two-component response regulator